MFDLGAWPPGEYLVMAEASGLTSRVVEVDTRTEAAAALQIFLHPCRPLAGQIRHGLRPIAGVELSLGGVLLATTAADGTYALCAFRDPSVKHSIHARSRHYTHARAFIEPHSVYVPRVSRSAVMAGVVRRRDGSPAAGIGVQANNAIETDHGFLPELAIVATTDAQGRFTIDGLSARGEWACFQYYDRGRLYACDEQALVKPSTDLRLVFDPAKVSRDEDALPPPTYVIAGRVTRGGAAVPDARILVHSYDAGDHETRTDRDGNFRVGQSAMQGTLDLHIGAPDGTHEKRSLPAGASIEGLQIAL